MLSKQQDPDAYALIATTLMMPCPVPAYTDENVSTKVIKLIQSYVGIINKMVWKKA